MEDDLCAAPGSPTNGFGVPPTLMADGNAKLQSIHFKNGALPVRHKTAIFRRVHLILCLVAEKLAGRGNHHRGIEQAKRSFPFKTDDRTNGEALARISNLRERLLRRLLVVLDHS